MLLLSYLFYIFAKFFVKNIDIHKISLLDIVPNFYWILSSFWIIIFNTETTIGGKSLHHDSLDKRINASGNLLKIGLIDLIEYLKQLSKELQAIKGQPTKPTKLVAHSMLEYISWEDKKLLKTVTTLGGSELYQYFKWIDEYCAMKKCSQKEALKRIIDEIPQ